MGGSGRRGRSTLLRPTPEGRPEDLLATPSAIETHLNFSPLARFLRPKEQYALPLASRKQENPKNPEGEEP